MNEVNEMGELAGRKILVTGAGSGIGLATAQVLVREGASIAAVVLDDSQRPAVEAAIPGVPLFALDLTQRERRNQLVEQASRALGGLDGLAACAGIFIRKPGLTISEEEWVSQIGVNLNATFFLCRAVLQHLLASGTKGSIVVVSSQLGSVGHPSAAAYAASKSALNGMVRSLALEVAQQGIRINAVGPGPVATALNAVVRADPARRAAAIAEIPMGRYGEPREIAETISFLLSERASFTTGSIVIADGGHIAR